jgi:hypothetical protein
MAAEKQPKKKASNAQGCGCLVVLVVLVVIIVAVATSGGSSGNAPKHFTVSDGAVSGLTKSVIDNAEDSPGLHGRPRAKCQGQAHCEITYTVKEPAGISSNLELIQPTAQIWKGLFEDRKFKGGIIEVKGPATSVGGKTTNSDLFSLSCDRQASNQIDWNDVQASGLKSLCVFIQQVKGL